MDVQAAVFHEMADRLHAVLVAPAGHAAVHRAAPGLGEGVEILVLGGGLLFAGQLELVGDVGFFPIDFPVGQRGVQFGAPVAAGLRLVVEETEDRLAEIGLEMIVVRLIDGFDETNRRSPCWRRRRSVVRFAQRRPLHVGELHDLPLARGHLPREFAVADVAGPDPRGCRLRFFRRPSTRPATAAT